MQPVVWLIPLLTCGSYLCSPVADTSAHLWLIPLLTCGSYLCLDSGLRHGHLASAKIQAFFAHSCFFHELRAKVDGDLVVQEYLLEMIKVNTELYPEFAAEVEGIAEGATCDVEDVWIMQFQGNLLNSS